MTEKKSFNSLQVVYKPSRVSSSTYAGRRFNSLQVVYKLYIKELENDRKEEFQFLIGSL